MGEFVFSSFPAYRFSITYLRGGMSGVVHDPVGGSVGSDVARARGRGSDAMSEFSSVTGGVGARTRCVGVRLASCTSDGGSWDYGLVEEFLDVNFDRKAETRHRSMSVSLRTTKRPCIREYLLDFYSMTES